MASKIQYQQLMLFLLSFIKIFANSSSSLLETHQNQIDYNNWLAWNIKNHQKRSILRKNNNKNKTSLESKLLVTTDTTLDEKLRNAETNKVTMSVGQDGSSDFATINEALNSIPNKNTKRVILAIKPGIYREKIIIRRNLAFVTLFGEASDTTIITGNDTASATGINGKPLRTFQSATVAVEANYFVAVNIRFENTAPHEVGSKRGQAVALRISGTKASFYNCSFYGTQDTLYDHKGLHYFHNCFIQGSVDFIFGYGRSFYENCYFNSTAKKVAFLTAQKRTSRSMESGFSFKDSVVSGSGHLYLGRAWGDYSRVVFSYTYMDTIVLPQGWSDWGDPNRDLKVYYAEYKCSGPGANLTGRVEWARMLSDEEAQPFIGTYYVEGDSWLITP